MYKKIFGILICILFIVTSLIPIMNLKAEELKKMKDSKLISNIISAVSNEENINKVMVLNYDNTSNIFNEDSRDNSNEWPLEIILTESSTQVMSMDISQNSQWIAYGGVDFNIYIHDTSDWSLIKTITNPGETIEALDFSTNNNYLACACEDKRVYIYDTSDWSLIKTITEVVGLDAYPFCIAFSEDNNWLAYGTTDYDNTVYIHSVGGDWPLIKELDADTHTVTSVKFSYDNQWLAFSVQTGSSIGNKVYVHHVGGTWPLEILLTEANDNIDSLDFSDNNLWIAYGSRDNNVYIHNMSDWSLYKTLTFGSQGCTDDNVEFSNNSVYLGYGKNSGNVYIHNTSDWGLFITLNETSDSIENAEFSKNDKWIAYCSSDSNVYIHNILFYNVFVDDDFDENTPGWQYDHFDVIQDGVDAVAEGGTVYVYNGTYYENVSVDKTINLTGEDRDETIIYGWIVSYTDFVNISGFFIRKESNYGVSLKNHNHVYNIDTNGIYVGPNSNYNLIENNIINGEGYLSNGILLDIHSVGGVGAAFNIIINNYILNCFYGLSMGGDGMDAFTHDNIAYRNVLFNNSYNAVESGSEPRNFWYNLSFEQGNYYDDYFGFDNNKDGIGDTPYPILGGINQDNYPLMYPWYPIHPDIVYVDDNYNISTPSFGYDKFNRIQYAINEVPENGTVYVYNGTYYENVGVNKCLAIQSVYGPSNCIVSALYTNACVFGVTNDYVNISGFTVKNATGDLIGGIYLAGVCYCDINQNKVSNNNRGIYLSYSNNNKIIGNSAHNNSNDGIYLDESNGNIIFSNNASNNEGDGIQLVDSSCNNNITGNDANSNGFCGITIYSHPYTSNNFNNITGNRVFDNNYGIYMDNSQNNTIYNNLFINMDNYYDNIGNNIWNISKTSGTNIIGGQYLGGNYWSDYNGTDTDGDGLGNTNIPYGPGDYLPLTNLISINIPLNLQWNLITIPVYNSMWASDVCENITGSQSLSRWNNTLQTYNTYIVGGPPSFDFPIQDGWGYFVDLNQTSNLSMIGQPINNVNVSLMIGWNLIGWYHNYNTTASSLSENITGCNSVSMWNASMQTYNTYIVGGPPTFDFIIKKGMGLFVDVSVPSIWHGEG